MDALRYVKGKATGDSSVEKHGDSTFLITNPGAFDADGEQGEPEVQGFQRADIAAMEQAAAKQVADAQKALKKAQERHAAHVELLADIDALL